MARQKKFLYPDDEYDSWEYEGKKTGKTRDKKAQRQARRERERFFGEEVPRD